jgi:tetratricopeptide (TPR) repeat protein
MKSAFLLISIWILQFNHSGCRNTKQSFSCDDKVYSAIIDSAEKKHAQGSDVWQKLLDSAISICPTKSYAWHARSVWHNKIGDYKTGFYYLNQAVKLDSFEIGYRGWIKLYKLHDYEGAISDLITYKLKYGNIPAMDENVSYLIGLAYKQIDSVDIAIDYFNSYIKIEASRNNDDHVWPYAYVYRGLCLEKKRNNVSSMMDFTRAIELYSSCVEAFFHRGRLFLDSKLPEKAYNDFTKSLQLYESGYYYKNEYKGIPTVNRATRYE